MLFSVIIPTCNRIEYLSKCLNLLTPFNQSFNSADYEVIITDDSSNNLTEDFVKSNYQWTRWLSGPKRGPASNRNNGANYAKGYWLIFIDDDCLPDRHLLHAYQEATTLYKDFLVFEGSIKADREKRSFIEESPINESGGHLWSCNFMIEKNLFCNKLKGFDEGFPYATMEDVELRHRIVENNIKYRFIQKALVIHPWRRQKNLVKVTFKRFESTLYFIKKHPKTYKDFNSTYFFRAFINGFFKNTLRNVFKYRMNGFLPKISFDFILLYFAVYFLFKKND